MIAGKRDLLLSRIQELYGISKEEGEKQAGGLGDAHAASRAFERNHGRSAEGLSEPVPAAAEC